MEFLGIFLKKFGPEYQPIFQQFFYQFFKNLLEKTSPVHNELLSAICVFDDYLEYVRDFAWEGGRSFIVDALLRNSRSPDAEIRQSAVYGLGVAAMFAGDSFAVYRA